MNDKDFWMFKGKEFGGGVRRSNDRSSKAPTTGEEREGADILVHNIANTQREGRMSESSYASQKWQDEPISILVE